MEEALQRKLNKRTKKKPDVNALVEAKNKPERDEVADAVIQKHATASKGTDDLGSKLPESTASSPPLTFQPEPSDPANSSKGIISKDNAAGVTSSLNSSNNATKQPDSPVEVAGESVEISGVYMCGFAF